MAFLSLSLLLIIGFLIFDFVSVFLFPNYFLALFEFILLFLFLISLFFLSFSLNIFNINKQISLTSLTLSVFKSLKKIYYMFF